MRSIPLLLVGDVARAEFAAVVRDLTGRPEARTCANIRVADGVMKAGDSPELIVLLQSRPGDFTAAELARIQQAVPLGRRLLVYGDWSEGEARSGKAEMGLIAIAASRWPEWWGIQQERVARGLPPAWARPITMSEEEQRWRTEDALPALSPEGRTIGIAARDRATAEALGEACRRRGYAVEMLPPENGVFAGCDLILWTDRGLESRELETMPEPCRDRPWIALVDFPRAEDCDRLTSLGAAAVCARPFDLDELFWRVKQLLARPSQSIA